LNERTIKIPAQNAIITLKKFGDVGGLKFGLNRAPTQGGQQLAGIPETNAGLT